MSDDGTRETVAELAATDPRVRLVDNPAGTAPAALNAAIRASTGTVVVRCDAHAVLPAGYVARAVAQLQVTGAANVGGIQAATGTSFVQRAIAMAMRSPLGVGDAKFRHATNAGPVDTVYLGVFRRNAIEAVGLFDERMVRNQDYELNVRLRDAGETVWLDPGLVVEYAPRRSLGALARQYFDYGAGKRKMLSLHPGSLRWRQTAPPALVVGLVGSAVAAVIGARAAATVLPATYAAVLVAGGAREAVRRRDPAAAIFPAATATMHVSWGLGFLIGRAPRPEARIET
jgi:glycosyltransferase involved in cell wall biosynthesis